MCRMLDLRNRTQARMRELIVCPNCKEWMQWGEDDITCARCSRRFPIREDIPILLVDQELAEHDELEHISERDHKRRQSAYFDRTELAEFETTRPRNEPALYGWFLLDR